MLLLSLKNGASRIYLDLFSTTNTFTHKKVICMRRTFETGINRICPGFDSDGHQQIVPA